VTARAQESPPPRDEEVVIVPVYERTETIRDFLGAGWSLISSSRLGPDEVRLVFKRGA